MNQHYDLVIHGAGIPGLALALSLTRGEQARKPSILLIDRQPLQAQPTVHDSPESENDFDQRVFALTYASKALLDSIDVWPGDQAARVYPHQNMHVWDAGGSGEIHFDAAEIGTPSLGYIVEGRVIHDWLVKAALDESNIDIVHDDSLDTADDQDSHLELHFSSGAQLNTQLLVGADGARSKVRELAGIEDIGWSYGQQAVVCTVETEKDHDATAWQRFLPEGPLAFLPMKRPWSSIVWSTSEEKAQWLCDASEEEFSEVLAADFQMTLGQIKSVGPRARFPLALRHAREYTASRIALVADAAHTVHPLAGQGLNLGLQDVQALAAQLQNALVADKDPGQRRVLRAYERSRKGDNWLMQGSFDVLKRMFSNEQDFLTQLRNTGLSTINRIPPLKNALVQKAMGL